MSDMKKFSVPVTVKIKATFERHVEARTLEEALEMVDELEIDDIVDDEEFLFNAYIDHWYVDQSEVSEE